MRHHSLTDIRAIIAMVLGLIGLFLVVCGLTTSDAAEMARTGGINANLWAGLGLLAIGLVMGAWWVLRPLAGDGVLAEELADGGAH